MEEIQEKKEQKNILFLVSSIGGGGAERVACRLVSAFSEKHNVYLMYFEKKEHEYQVDPKVVKIPFFADDILKKMIDKPKKKISQKELRMNEVEKIRTQYKIDITISFLFWPNMYNVNAGGGTIKILSERNDPDGKGEDYFKSMISAYEKADIVVFQTNFTRNKFPDNIKKKGMIIPNPISITCPADPSLTKKKIVNVGRLVPQKNHFLLIEAFSMFTKKHSGYHLHIYGLGNLEDELKVLVKQSNLEEFVHFEGFCGDIHEKIKDAEQFVLSSDYEGMPNALMEAMLMGLPCISTKCSGVGEIVTNEVDGILVPLKNASALADAMSRLSDDKDLRDKLGQAASTKAEIWKTELIAELWEDLF